jgi:hypothetical protein
MLSQLLYYVFDVVHSSIALSHELCWVVNMTTWSAVLLEYLRHICHLHIEVFSHPLNKIPCHPQMITNINASTRSNLELPLPRHSFSICPCNLNASPQTRSVVCVHYCSAKAEISSHWTVEGTLVARESPWWPTKWLQSEFILYIYESVLLLNTKPWLFVRYLVHYLLCKNTEVGVGWLFCYELRICPYKSFA